MSLLNSDDKYDELITEKKIIPKNFFKNKKLIILFFIVGFVVGLCLYHFLLAPLNAELATSNCTTIKNTNQLLNNENDCLYSLLGDSAKTASEKCGKQNNPKKLINQ